jgi:hypothetical protein
MRHTASWTVEILLYEEDDHTSARATLGAGAGAGAGTEQRRTVAGAGRATRNPADPSVPEIGEEIAAARALRDLADRLLQAASADITRTTRAEVHLSH